MVSLMIARYRNLQMAATPETTQVRCRSYPTLKSQRIPFYIITGIQHF